MAGGRIAVAGRVARTGRVATSGRVALSKRYPLDVPQTLSGLRNWLRADAGITLNTTTVSKWEDLSGNGHHVTEPTNQPLFVASAQNGRPAVRGNGTNAKLTSAAYTRVQPVTVFCVFKYIAVGASDVLFNSSTAVDALQFAQDNSPEYYCRSGGLGVLVPGSNVASGAYATLRANFNGATSEMAINGTVTDTGNVGATNGGGLLLFCNFGSVQFTNAEIGEYIEYDRILTSPEAATIQAYLKSFWGTP